MTRSDYAHPLPAAVTDSGAGYIVSDDAGWRYATDEHRHQLIIETDAGDERRVGGAGSRLGEFLYPRGLALVPGASRDLTRVFVCDAWNHRIQILDGHGRAIGAFGRHQLRPGHLDIPTDIAVVTLDYPDEDLDPREGTMLAVADRWNGRIHVFEMDGVPVRSFGVAGDNVWPESVRGFTRAGWPFFRVGLEPVMRCPIRLAWQSPRLIVTCGNGRVVHVDLAAAVLPDFEEWRATASEVTLAAAARRFRAFERRGVAVAPAAALAAIETDLGRHYLARQAFAAVEALWTAAPPQRLTRLASRRTLDERRQLIRAAEAAHRGEHGLPPALRRLTAAIAQPDPSRSTMTLVHSPVARGMSRFKEAS